MRLKYWSKARFRPSPAGRSGAAVSALGGTKMAAQRWVGLERVQGVTAASDKTLSSRPEEVKKIIFKISKSQLQCFFFSFDLKYELKLGKLCL